MIEDLHGHWNVQLTCGSGWTKAAEQHQMFSAEHSDISLCALEMTAVKTDNQLNMQKQTCIQPHLATHTHTQARTYRITYTNPQSFDSSSSGFDGRGILMWHVCCYLRLVSPVSLSSDFFSFELIAFLTSVHAIVLHHQAAFHFLSLLLLLSFFSLIFVVRLINHFNALPSSVFDTTGQFMLPSFAVLMQKPNIHVELHGYFIFLFKNKQVIRFLKVLCEEETTFTHLGGAGDGNWAKRNLRCGCEHRNKEAVKKKKKKDWRMWMGLTCRLGAYV